MKQIILLSVVTTSAMLGSASAVTVISQAIEDGWLYNSTNRNEQILNNTVNNNSRWGAVRFDSTILAAQAFTDSGAFTLDSATLTLVERTGRDGINGTLSGRAGAAFYDTATVSGWSHSNLSTFTWAGNTQGRPGRVGGTGTTPGANNIDERSNGAAPLLAGLTRPATAGDGTSWVNHTFSTGGADELVTIDLTAGGASLAEIQSILADWVAGNNAGMVLAGEFGNQAFFDSVSIGLGNSVGSTIDGDATNSGVSLEAGAGDGGNAAYLTLNFTPVVPEPSTAVLSALAALGLLRRRR